MRSTARELRLIPSVSPVEGLLVVERSRPPSSFPLTMESHWYGMTFLCEGEFVEGGFDVCEELFIMDKSIFPRQKRMARIKSD